MDIKLNLGMQALSHVVNFASRFVEIDPICTKYSDQVEVGGLNSDDLQGTSFRSSSFETHRVTEDPAEIARLAQNSKLGQSDTIHRPLAGVHSVKAQTETVAGYTISDGGGHVRIEGQGQTEEINGYLLGVPGQYNGMNDLQAGFNTEAGHISEMIGTNQRSGQYLQAQFTAEGSQTSDSFLISDGHATMLRTGRKDEDFNSLPNYVDKMGYKQSFHSEVTVLPNGILSYTDPDTHQEAQVRLPISPAMVGL